MTSTLPRHARFFFFQREGWAAYRGYVSIGYMIPAERLGSPDTTCLFLNAEEATDFDNHL